MRDPRDMMIQRQAEIITELRAVPAKLEDRIIKLEREIDRLKVPAQYWLDMQKQIVETPLLQGQWETFLMYMKLAADEKYLKNVDAYRPIHGKVGSPAGDSDAGGPAVG